MTVTTLAAAPQPSRATLQQRLLLALAAVSVGAVIVTGVVTAGAARRATRSAVAAEMRREAAAFSDFAATGAATQRCALRATRLVRFARNDNAGVALVRNGAVVQANGSVRAGVLDPGALERGLVQTVTRPRFVLVAQPLPACPAGTPVFVLERAIGGGVGPIGRGLVVAAVLAAVAAIAVSAAVSRHLALPLRSAQRAAETIAGGDLSARVAVTRDAPAEIAGVATAINDMAAGLAAAREHERAFLMSISHDLRTPLTSIRGYAEAMADGALGTEAERARAAAVIGQEGRRLERLVADLLDLARLDAHEFSLRLETTDIVPVVRAAAEAFVPAGREAGVEITLDLAPHAVATVDADRLGQITGNLVENALKYASGNVVVRVTAPGHSGGQGEAPRGAALVVLDDGPGIDPTDAPHVFDRLYSARPGAARAIGTGLGLAIVRELTTAMGAAVEAGPRPGGGACLTVRF